MATVGFMPAGPHDLRATQGDRSPFLSSSAARRKNSSLMRVGSRQQLLVTPPPGKPNGRLTLVAGSYASAGQVRRQASGWANDLGAAPQVDN